MSKDDCMNTLSTYNLFFSIRSQAKIDDKCYDRINSPDPNEHYECFDEYCLFDLQQDPCEYKNIGKQNQQALNMTIDMLNQFKKELVRQNEINVDPNANPSHFDGYWDTWLEGNDSGALKESKYVLIFVFCFYYLSTVLKF